MPEPVARAVVPGHVTGLFAVHQTDDPVRTGSRGAGFTMTDGVTVTVRPNDERKVLVDGEPTTVGSVQRVLEDLGVTARVEIETDLPIGTGFGLSGGMGLGTAFGANAVFDLGQTTTDLIRVAHVADVEAGTGLGDVVAQARGGLVLRLEAGAPPHGRLDGIETTARVEYLTRGELSTPTVLNERPAEITRAGNQALETLLADPTRDRFLEAAQEFTADVGLATESVRTILETVEANGGQAAMAMLGETVFAFDHDLSDAGYDPQVAAIDPCGASLE